jgi:hypothetical protein
MAAEAMGVNKNFRHGDQERTEVFASHCAIKGTRATTEAAPVFSVINWLGGAKAL